MSLKDAKGASLDCFHQALLPMMFDVLYTFRSASRGAQKVDGVYLQPVEARSRATYMQGSSKRSVSEARRRKQIDLEYFLPLCTCLKFRRSVSSNRFKRLMISLYLRHGPE